MFNGTAGMNNVTNDPTSTGGGPFSSSAQPATAPTTRRRGFFSNSGRSARTGPAQPAPVGGHFGRSRRGKMARENRGGYTTNPNSGRFGFFSGRNRANARENPNAPGTGGRFFKTKKDKKRAEEAGLIGGGLFAEHERNKRKRQRAAGTRGPGLFSRNNGRTRGARTTRNSSSLPFSERMRLFLHPGTRQNDVGPMAGPALV